MSDVIKNKIKQINNPTVNNRRSFTTVGKIIAINEKTNECDIQYLNNDGNYSNKTNVYVKLNMPGVLGWFPKKDDFVSVEITDMSITIVGPAEDRYEVNTRPTIQTPKEALSSNIGCTMAGMIF